MSKVSDVLDDINVNNIVRGQILNATPLAEHAGTLQDGQRQVPDGSIP